MNYGLLTKMAGSIESGKQINGYKIIGSEYQIVPLARLVLLFVMFAPVCKLSYPPSPCLIASTFEILAHNPFHIIGT